jgi:hypothetical protein
MKLLAFAKALADHFASIFVIINPVIVFDWILIDLGTWQRPIDVVLETTDIEGKEDIFVPGAPIFVREKDRVSVFAR